MKEKKKSLLWRMDHPALAGPSFLFGTMHVRDEQAFEFLEQIYHHLDQCEAFAAEYDVDEPPSADMERMLLLPPGRRLSDFFKAGQYQKLRAILRKAFRIDIDHYSHFVPLMIINTISERLLQQDRPQTLDLQLWSYAGQAGKLRLGIETLSEQLSVLHKIPLERQLRQLRALGRNVNRFRKTILKNTAIYRRGDPHRIYQMVRQNSQGLREELLFRRNRIMAGRIDGMVRGQSTFCAVGAGHLSGKYGLIRLLKQRGFRLHPIPMDLPSGTEN